MRLGIFTNQLRRFLMKPIFLFVFLTFPVFLAMILSTLLQETVKQSAIPIAIVDRDETDFSRLIINRMKEHKGIEVMELDETSAIRGLKRGEVDTVFIIKTSFEQQLLAEKREKTVELWTTPLSMATGIVKEMMGSEIIRITSHIKAGNWVTEFIGKRKELSQIQKEELWLHSYNYSESQWDPEPLMTIQHESANEQSMNTGSTKALNNSYIGYWSFFTMLFCFILTESIVKERKSIMPRVRGMYNNVGVFILQKGMAYFVILLIQALFSLSLLHYVNLIDIHISVLGNVCLFLFFSLTISVGLGCYANHIGFYYGSGLVVVILTSIASGVYFPIADLYEKIVQVAEFFPQEWLMSEERKHVLVVFIFCIFIWVMSIWKLEREND